MSKTKLIVREAMKITSNDVRSPKCVRDGLVKPVKQKVEDEIRYYPYIVGWIKYQNEKELKRLNKFFNTDKIEFKEYSVCVWIKGKASENTHGIIPVGIPVEINLGYRNSFKYRKNIEGVFDIDGRFEFEKKQEVADWFFKKILKRK